MLIPKHCSEVAVVNVGKGFLPTEKIIDLLGQPTNYLTKYIILRERDGHLTHGERVCLIKVQTEGGNYLKTICEVEVLATPEQCITVVDPNIDEFILHQVVLGAISARSHGEAKTVILSGRNENITFVILGERKFTIPLKILLVDITPPAPSRLETLTTAAKASRLISKYIAIEFLFLDTSEMVKETIRAGRTPLTLCLTEEFLTLNPSIATLKDIQERSNPHDLDLIGCDLSNAIILEFSKITSIDLNLNLKDMCPLHAGREASSRAAIHGLIVRCCKITQEIRTLHSQKKPLMVLSWTPSIGEFVKAINNIVRLVLKVEVD